MKYSIVKNPNYTSTVKIGLDITPDDEILRLFLAVIKIGDYPKLITAVSKSTRFGMEDADIMFFHEMDWEAKAALERIGGIKEGEVDIYLYDGRPNDTVLNEKLFDRILYDYSLELLEVYRKSKEVRESWAEEMESAISKLKQKIEAKYRYTK